MINIRKVKPGERLRAETVNQIIDALAELTVHSDGSIEIYRGGGGTILGVLNKDEAVQFKNISGGTCPPYGVLGLTDITLDNPDPYFLQADKQGTTFYRSFIVNGASEVATNTIGRGYLVNGSHNRLVLAAYDSGGCCAIGKDMGMKPGQYTLSRGFPGMFTVAGIFDSTNRWALGVIHPVQRLLVKTTTAHAKGDSHDCDIYCGTTKGSETDSTMDITLYNRFADLDDDVWAHAMPFNEDVELSAGECPA